MIAEGLQPDYHDKTDQSDLKTDLSLKKTTLSLTRDTLLFHGIPFTEGSLTISKSNFDIHKKYSLQI